MLRLFRRLMPVAVLAWALAGCQALTGETLGENIDDTTITTTVKAKLAADKAATLTRVEVDTDRGVVQLSGVVKSAADKTRAGEIARSVSGVRRVVNNLQVQ